MSGPLVRGCQGVKWVRGVLGAWQGMQILRGQKGYRQHKGALGAPRGVDGAGQLLGASEV